MTNVSEDKMITAIERFRDTINEALTAATEALKDQNFEQACRTLDRASQSMAKVSVGLRGILIKTGKIEER